MEQIALKKPIFECVSIRKKDEKLSVQTDGCLVPFGIDDDVALTNSQAEHSFFASREFMNESITNPSRKTFLSIKLMELDKVCSELQFEDVDAVISAFNILNICAQNKNFNVNVSKTAEGEILIYSKEKNKFKNLLIDSDGDIHFILIGSKLGEEDTAFFPKDSKLNYNHIASLI